MDPQPNIETPYSSAFQQYWDAKWRGVLPLPPNRKKSPPSGYTGYGGDTPSYPDALTWIETGKYRCETADGKTFWPPVGNICLRLPADIIGIDVDAYGDKTGGETLRHAESLWGALPPTVRSTARDDMVSGIRLYRVPPGTALQTVVRFPEHGLGNIEVCQATHRYVVVWPSIHPDTHTEYRWLDADGFVLDDVPRCDKSIPDLPPAWLEALSATPAPEVTPTDVHAALARMPKGDPDQVVKDRYDAAVASLRGSEGSRHDSVLGHVMSLLRAAEQGHTGVDTALTALRWQFLSAVVADGSRSPGEAESEWTRMVAGKRGHALIAATPSPDPDKINEELRQLAGLAGDPDPDPPGFWESRPELATIRRAAWSQVVSPWGVLGAVLLRVACLVPPEVVLPDVISGVGSLNLIVCLVAPSGGGKDSAMAVAERIYPAPDHFTGVDRVYTAPMGSGEGFVHQFVYRNLRKTEDDDEDRFSGLERGMHWIRRSVLLHAMEVDAARAISMRDGSTLLSVLRTLYSGGTLGASNATPEKRLPVPKHTYRAGVALGVQPSHAKWILDDVTGGLPQRCLWMPCTDPNIPEQSPGFPTPLRSIRDHEIRNVRVVEIPEEITGLIRSEALRRARGETDALDGHGLFTREKVAYLLAVLCGRPYEMTMGDWELSGQLMAVSDSTRAGIQRVCSEEVRRENAARARAEAEREVIKMSLLEEEQERKMRVRVQVKFVKAGGSMTRKTFNDAFDSAARKAARETLERLIEAGRVRVGEAGLLHWNEG